MQKIKILRLTTIPLTLNLLLKNQLKYLNNKYEIVAISSPGIDLLEVRNREGVRTIPIKMVRNISLFKDIYSLFKLLFIISRERPLIIHSNTPKASLLSMFAGFILKIPVRVYTITGLRYEGCEGIKRRLLIYIEKITCYFSTHVLCESNGVLNKILLENINLNKVQLLNPSNLNGVDPEYFNPFLSYPNYRSKFKLSTNDFIFLFVGRVSRDKGIFELISAFKKLEVENNNLKLLVLGTLELNELEKKTFYQEIHFSNNIITHEFSRDIRPFLNVCDCLVLPSYREGFPNVILEAGSMGKPVIMSNVNGSEEYICDINGLVFKNKDTNDLYDKMYCLSLNKNSYNSNQIRQRILNNFSSEMVYKELDRFYSKFAILN
ncbi:glycosyltransferase family 4 protein [Aquirufa antheringensis]|uniref:glycosyltransferase family 4 protein n=1 Tax=Aquirufa antheringensis TaxID=2516559 RepID=UPI0022A923BE|nr:glycosyltransferase family 4 protein [Aquirufa antheringensis]MCZ2490069.1 glycosyltransferase family 4 protein [Aquirufa antheringensis]